MTVIGVMTGSADVATSRSLPTAIGKKREMGVVMAMVATAIPRTRF